ncbi:MAG: histidine kinase [Cytophagales bacterium]
MQKTNYDSLAALESSLVVGVQKVDLMYLLAQEVKDSDTQKAYKFGKTLYNISIEIGYYQGEIKGLLTMGECLDNQGQVAESVQMLEEALKISRDNKNEKLISDCLKALFYVYYNTQNLDVAEKYLIEKAEIDAKTEQTKGDKAVNLDLLGLINEEKGKFSMALQCYKQALNAIENSNDTILRSTLTNNIGIVYFKQGQLDSALAYHRKALKLRETKNDEYRIGFVTLWLSKTLLFAGYTDSALYYAQKGLAINLKGGPEHASLLAYEVLTDIYKSKQVYQKALLYKEKYDSINNIINNADQAKLIARVESKYLIEQKNKEIKYKEQEIENKNFIIYITLIVIAFVISISLVLYNRNMVRKRLNLLLSQQKAELFEKNQEIEAQNEELSEKNQEIETQNEEISAVNLNLEEAVASRTKLLVESEELLSMSQSLAKLGSWSLDLNTGVYMLSKEVYNIFHFSPDFEPSLDTLFPFVGKDKSREFRSKIQATVEKNIPFEFEFELLTHDTIQKYIYVLAIPDLNSKTEKVVCIKGCVQDITERKVNELNFVSQTGELIESNKKMAEFKLMALRSVMNPHFLFNSLNSIQYFIAKNIKEKAIDYLSQFSKLMRLILNSSINNTITLSQEIEMLKLYVSLESLRFDKFTIKFFVEPDLDIDYIEIPSLLIQPFVENAILHGLSNLSHNDGELEISFKMQDDKLLCIIEDNGIGRAAAKNAHEHEIKLHKSVGMLVTSERINMVSSDDLLAMNITDKTDENGNATGTKVEIVLAID